MSLTRRCSSQTVLSWSWSLGRYHGICLIYRAVEGWGAVAHSAILHSLLQLLILELGVEGGRVVHKVRWVKHRIRVEVVEACAIVVLDGGVVHPGAHVCGKELRQPICRCDKTSAMLFLYCKRVSMERPADGRQMDKRDSRQVAMKVATRLMMRRGDKGERTSMPHQHHQSSLNNEAQYLQDVTRHLNDQRRGGGRNERSLTYLTRAELLAVDCQIVVLRKGFRAEAD